MASVGAHLMNHVLRWYIKRRLDGVVDVYRARAVFQSGPIMPMPRSLSAKRTAVDSIGGERVEPRRPTRRTLLYLHGGGYVGCSPQTHRPITTAFAGHGFAVFAPDYRLAPEHPFPAALEDALAAFRGLVAAGVPPGSLVVAGDSSGGGLAVAMLVALRDSGGPLPAAAALFSPWTDLAGTGGSSKENAGRDPMIRADLMTAGAQAYLGAVDPRTPLASPLYAQLNDLPPLLIHVGEREVLRDDSTRLAERARAAGVAVELAVWPVAADASPDSGRPSLARARGRVPGSALRRSHRGIAS